MDSMMVSYWGMNKSLIEVFHLEVACYFEKLDQIMDLHEARAEKEGWLTLVLVVTMADLSTLTDVREAGDKTSTTFVRNDGIGTVLAMSQWRRLPVLLPDR
jgi:hypothetical protein